MKYSENIIKTFFKNVLNCDLYKYKEFVFIKKMFRPFNTINIHYLNKYIFLSQVYFNIKTNIQLTIENKTKISVVKTEELNFKLEMNILVWLLSEKIMIKLIL